MVRFEAQASRSRPLSRPSLKGSTPGSWATFEFVLHLFVSSADDGSCKFATCSRENSSRLPGPPWVPYVSRLSRALDTKVIG